ncbi:MAG: pilus assembly protein [Alphaproteobacteria bacterium]|nr:MAG: pilus assembly protein [Alphaproteobacteria bacterium]
MKRLVNIFRKDAKGAVAVEFAFFAPIIIASIGLMTMYGMATYDKMRMTAGSRAIMQYMLVGGQDVTLMDAIMYKSSGIDANVSVSTYCSCSNAKDSSLSCSSTATCAEGTKNEYRRITATARRNFFIKSWDIKTQIDFRKD